MTRFYAGITLSFAVMALLGTSGVGCRGSSGKNSSSVSDADSDTPLIDSTGVDGTLVPTDTNREESKDDLIRGDTIHLTGEVKIGSPGDGEVLNGGVVLVDVEWKDAPASAQVRLLVDNGIEDTLVDVQSKGEGTLTADLSSKDGLDRTVRISAVLVLGDQEIHRDSIGVLVHSQKLAQRRLAERTTGEVTVKFQAGVPVLVIANVQVDGADPVDRAFNYLNEFSDLYAIDDPKLQLLIGAVIPSEGGETTVQFVQKIDDIPVHASYLNVHLLGDVVVHTTAEYALNEPLGIDDGVEILSFATAYKIAKLIHPAADSKERGDPQMVYFDAGIAGRPLGPDRPRLAWRVFVQGIVPETGVPERWQFFIDAITGDVLDHTTDYVQECKTRDLDLDIGDVAGETSEWCFWTGWSQTLCNEDSCNTNDPEAYAAFDYAHYTYDYYFDELCRDSFDDDNEQVEVAIHLGKNNAYSWGSCGQLQFGTGYVVPDTFAHEYTHSVVYNTARLKYFGASGALNEGYADTFGGIIEGRMLGIEFDSDHHGSRNMQNPGMYTYEGVPYPDHMSKFDLWFLRTDTIKLNGTQIKLDVYFDDGGVHFNCTIIGKASYLLALGDKHNGWTIQPIGAKKLQRLYYDVLRKDLGSRSGFERMQEATVARARLYLDQGLYGFTNQDVCSVVNAFASVGLGPGDTDCDGQTDDLDYDDDQDGTADESDNCPLVWNMYQTDIDGDGLGDACDPDMDGDGLNNEVDNCPAHSNPNQPDRDKDGKGDHCDDDDKDFVFDIDDNCPDVANFMQEDFDADGIGDLCDLDRDGDLIENSKDNCPLHPNTTQSDADNDKIGDKCDNCPKAYNPYQVDTDNDKLGDECDEDDDGDMIPDGDDNCPKHHNPSQFDDDGDGIGYECDPDEISSYLNNIKQKSHKITAKTMGELVSPLIPIPICDICPDWLPYDYALSLEIYTVAPMIVALFDQFGSVVAWSHPDKSTLSWNDLGETIHFLRFKPGSKSLWGKKKGSMFNSGTRYYLRVMADLVIAPRISELDIKIKMTDPQPDIP